MLMNPALRDFWATKSRYKALRGGRDSSKSHDAAGNAIRIADYCKVKFLCVRQFQNRIDDSVYTVLKDKIAAFGLQDRFYVTNNRIKNLVTGSEFMFYGIQRNLTDIKSVEGADILWIEEAEGLTEEQMKVLRPTIRKEGSEIWLVWNPRFKTDYIHKRFVVDPPKDCVSRLINYDENPFLSETSRKEIEQLKEDDYEEYQHVYLGVPKDSSENSIIKLKWIEAVVDAHLKITPLSGEWLGGVTVGYDVADDGDDANATTTMDGYVAVHVDEWKAGEDELDKSAGRVVNTAKRLNASLIGYDSIGVGAGTGAHFNHLKWRKHFKFNAAAKVAKPEKYYSTAGKIKNKDHFENLKAQAWRAVSDRFKNTYLAVTKGRKFRADQMISISSEIDKKLLEKLKEELSVVEKTYSSSGKEMVESKKQLRAREVDSPNIADSFIIANSRSLVARANIADML